MDQREFSGADCQLLGDAAALVIALGIDPVGVSVHLAEQSEPEPEPAPEPEPEPTFELLAEPEQEGPAEPLRSRSDRADGSSRSEAERQPPNVHVGVAALGGGGYGPLRLGQGGVGIELSGFGPWWRAALRGRWIAPRTQTLAAGNQARFDGFAVAARACAVPWAGPVEFPICAGIEAGALRGRGAGTTVAARDATVPWAAALVGPGLRWVVHEHVALGLDLELLAPLVRGGFSIGGAVIQELTPVGVQGLVGVEFRLP